MRRLAVPIRVEAHRCCGWYPTCFYYTLTGCVLHALDCFFPLLGVGNEVPQKLERSWVDRVTDHRSFFAGPAQAKHRDPRQAITRIENEPLLTVRGAVCPNVSSVKLAWRVLHRSSLLEEKQ